jgi:hypothetical protein
MKALLKRPKTLTARDQDLANAEQDIREGVERNDPALILRGTIAKDKALSSPATVICSNPECGKEFPQGDELIVGVVSVLKKTRKGDGSVETEWLVERELSAPIPFAFCPDCSPTIPVIDAPGPDHNG